ncbi:MAG: class I SAM-dependent DNA methyltransferase [Oligoflexia bacterium]|nr:class I SAM-dependent DNA methyltransferase [Oligoflexia bacterium]
MNAVEIEEAVSRLAEEPFDPASFPYAFLEAFGNKVTTIQRLRTGSSNKSDIDGCILQHNNIHISVSPVGKTQEMLGKLRESPATIRHKAKFILATDGKEFQAEDISSGETVACEYKDFPDHFGFFLPLAGISTVQQIRESSFDIKATGRLNRLYVELLKDNPKWGSAERRHDMNHFMARLIFCFFAEDTEIFSEVGLFTKTVQQMSASDSSNTHEVVSEIFRAMATTASGRRHANLPRWADFFPYVNGGLFSGSTEVPRFSKIARAYLLSIGALDWKKINPDIFGSMIQAVAEDEERGELGMHYTSVSNIKRVLNPLFLDHLRSQLEKAGDNQRMLLNLRKRISRIRVFDPACGSGNFLVIAYKEMREIENEINKRRKEEHLRSEIHLTNFRGIELRDFPAEVARLALIIAEYQCDVLYRGQKEALAEFLPLESENWITCGNALEIDWTNACPTCEGEEGEVYICGNPPYKGRNKKGDKEKAETISVFAKYGGSYASLDYVANWLIKSAEYCSATVTAKAGLVATNSVCQGEQVALLWPLIFKLGVCIPFAHTSFKWSNLATYNAGVTVIVVGLGRANGNESILYSDEEARKVRFIGPYLVPNSNVIVPKRETPLSEVGMMFLGNMAKDGGNLIMDPHEASSLIARGVDPKFIKKFFGSEELIHAKPRACLWIDDANAERALESQAVSEVVNRVKNFRLASKAPSTRNFANVPYKFVQISARTGERAIIIPRVSSESRPFLPVDYFADMPVIGDKCYAIYDEPIWNLAIIASRLHLVWIGTICSRLEMRFSYGNKLGWNTFPLPPLTDQNKVDLNRCAEDILLAREAHFPATIADLYEPDSMPDDLCRAHERNDEVLERIYIGRRFKNDSERLEKLFELYTKMAAAPKAVAEAKRKSKKKESQA